MDPAMAATVTLLHVTTENRGAARLDGMHHTPLHGAEDAAIGFAVSRSMQTKDVRDLKRRLAHRKLLSRALRLGFGARDLADLLYGLGQQVEGARSGTNGMPRYMGVAGGCPQAAMTEQDLDPADVGASFQEMGRKRKAQGTDMGGFRQTGGQAGFDADLMNGFTRNGVRGRFAREQPFLRACQLPVGAQQFQQMRRKHDIAIFLPFSQFDADHHAVRIDIGDAQGDDFADPQACGIGRHDNRPVFEIGNALKETANLLLA